MEGMQTMTPQKPQPIYDLNRYRQRLADAVDPMKVKQGPSKWMAGRTVEAAQAEADKEKRTAFKEFWNPDDVAAISKEAVENFAKANGERLMNSFPKLMRDKTRMMEPKAQTLPDRPQCALAPMLQIEIRLADGSRGALGLSIGTFRAAIKGNGNGGIEIGEIEKKKTNEEHERVLYGQVYRLDANGKNLGIDTRYGPEKDGTVFRVSGSATDQNSINAALMRAREACCKVAGFNPAIPDKPAAQQAPQSRADRMAAFEAQQTAQRNGGPASPAPAPARRAS